MADEETETEEGAEESGGGLMKKLIIGVVVLAVLGGGAFAIPSIRNMIIPPPEDENAEVVEEESVKSALYTSLAPPLMVNITDASGETHFMQITMEVMAYDQGLLNSVREHAPIIRNNLILLFGTSTFDEVNTREGKEKMLAEGLEEIRAIMLQRVGDDSVEELYFTNLIIQ